MARYIRLPDKKTIFIRVPKVASSSIKFALLSKHLPGNEGEDKADRNVGDLFPDDFKFAVVRNPWDRLVS